MVATDIAGAGLFATRVTVAGVAWRLTSRLPVQQRGALIPAPVALQQSICRACTMAQARVTHGAPMRPAMAMAALSSTAAGRRLMTSVGWPLACGVSTHEYG